MSEPQFIITEADLPPAAPQPVLQQRMMLILMLAVMAIIGFAVVLAPRLQMETTTTAAVVPDVAAETAVLPNPPVATGIISPVFSPEVQHWASQIVAWSNEHGLDPDITATIMQIESCGDPQALSHAGAHGLFQVMPFHFETGEDMFDPDTNAFRGLSFYAYVLDLTDGNVGLAFAGYNGGPGAALSSWGNWLPETQRYYTWGTGIYEDAKAGLEQSPTLQEWMTAGGVSLCQQAATRLGLQ
ncbi:MAG: transglycosylase SLT domain-containing protein [Anaerolineales bacterium]|nr:transglycosylase SLT domain-containing protein [Anaerolineales bacterium]MCB8968974.1 transglycosylase SLT domain-containing protein [Ardenticatenaceae bacterium]